MNTEILSPMKTDRPGWCGPCSHGKPTKVIIPEGEPRFFHCFKKYVLCEPCAEAYDDSQEQTQPPNQKRGAQGSTATAEVLSELQEIKTLLRRLEVLFASIIVNGVKEEEIKPLLKQARAIVNGGN